MINNKDYDENKISFRKANIEDFDKMLKIIGNYYSNLNLKETHTYKTKSPWIWIDDPQVSFNLMIIDKNIVGFYIARFIHLNNHLHSFFIDKNFRSQGLGTKLLKEHWREGLEKKSFQIDTFTLHVHTINNFAANFYQKFSYTKVPQTKKLLIQEGGLGSWARNCNRKDQWPLKYGIDLYYLPIKKLKI